MATVPHKCSVDKIAALKTSDCNGIMNRAHMKYDVYCLLLLGVNIWYRFI